MKNQWIVTKEFISRKGKNYAVNEDGGKTIVRLIDKQDADLIVRAVNAHEEMLEAAREARAGIQEAMKKPGVEYLANAFYHLETAIAKAEGRA